MGLSLEVVVPNGELVRVWPGEGEPVRLVLVLDPSAHFLATVAAGSSLPGGQDGYSSGLVAKLAGRVAALWSAEPIWDGDRSVAVRDLSGWLAGGGRLRERTLLGESVDAVRQWLQAVRDAPDVGRVVAGGEVSWDGFVEVAVAVAAAERAYASLRSMVDAGYRQWGLSDAQVRRLQSLGLVAVRASRSGDWLFEGLVSAAAGRGRGWLDLGGELAGEVPRAVAQLRERLVTLLQIDVEADPQWYGLLFGGSAAQGAGWVDRLVHVLGTPGRWGGLPAAGSGSAGPVFDDPALSFAAVGVNVRRADLRVEPAGDGDQVWLVRGRFVELVADGDGSDVPKIRAVAVPLSGQVAEQPSRDEVFAELVWLDGALSQARSVGGRSVGDMFATVAGWRVNPTRASTRIGPSPGRPPFDMRLTVGVPLSRLLDELAADVERAAVLPNVYQIVSALKHAGEGIAWAEQQAQRYLDDGGDRELARALAGFLALLYWQLAVKLLGFGPDAAPKDHALVMSRTSMGGLRRALPEQVEDWLDEHAGLLRDEAKAAFTDNNPDYVREVADGNLDRVFTRRPRDSLFSPNQYVMSALQKGAKHVGQDDLFLHTHFREAHRVDGGDRTALAVLAKRYVIDGTTSVQAGLDHVDNLATAMAGWFAALDTDVVMHDAPAIDQPAPTHDQPWDTSRTLIRVVARLLQVSIEEIGPDGQASTRTPGETKPLWLVQVAAQQPPFLATTPADITRSSRSRTGSPHHTSHGEPSTPPPPPADTGGRPPPGPLPLPPVPPHVQQALEDNPKVRPDTARKLWGQLWITGGGHTARQVRQDALAGITNERTASAYLRALEDLGMLRVEKREGRAGYAAALPDTWDPNEVGPGTLQAWAHTIPDPAQRDQALHHIDHPPPAPLPLPLPPVPQHVQQALEENIRVRPDTARTLWGQLWITGRRTAEQTAKDILAGITKEKTASGYLRVLEDLDMLQVEKREGRPGYAAVLPDTWANEVGPGTLQAWAHTIPDPAQRDQALHHIGHPPPAPLPLPLPLPPVPQRVQQATEKNENVRPDTARKLWGQLWITGPHSVEQVHQDTLPGITNQETARTYLRVLARLDMLQVEKREGDAGSYAAVLPDTWDPKEVGPGTLRAWAHTIPNPAQRRPALDRIGHPPPAPLPPVPPHLRQALEENENVRPDTARKLWGQLWITGPHSAKQVSQDALAGITSQTTANLYLRSLARLGMARVERKGGAGFYTAALPDTWDPKGAGPGTLRTWVDTIPDPDQQEQALDRIGHPPPAPPPLPPVPQHVQQDLEKTVRVRPDTARKLWGQLWITGGGHTAKQVSQDALAGITSWTAADHYLRTLARLGMARVEREGNAGFYTAALPDTWDPKEDWPGKLRTWANTIPDPEQREQALNHLSETPNTTLRRVRERPGFDLPLLTARMPHPDWHGLLRLANPTVIRQLWTYATSTSHGQRPTLQQLASHAGTLTRTTPPTVKPVPPTPDDHGWFDPLTWTVYITTHQPTDQTQTVLVHELGHAEATYRSVVDPDENPPSPRQIAHRIRNIAAGHPPQWPPPHWPPRRHAMARDMLLPHTHPHQPAPHTPEADYLHTLTDIAAAPTERSALAIELQFRTLFHTRTRPTHPTHHPPPTYHLELTPTAPTTTDPTNPTNPTNRRTRRIKELDQTHLTQINHRTHHLAQHAAHHTTDPDHTDAAIISAIHHALQHPQPLTTLRTTTTALLSQNPPANPPQKYDWITAIHRLANRFADHSPQHTKALRTVADHIAACR
jgi:hypothetical protein